MSRKPRLKWTLPPEYLPPTNVEDAMARNLQRQMQMERDKRVLVGVLEGMFDSLVPREKDVTGQTTYEIGRPKMLEGGKS